MKIILCFILFIPLFGCESLIYKEPTKGPRAQVRFVTTSTSTTILRVYDDSNCTSNEAEWMRLRNGFKFNSNTKVLGMPLWDYNKNAAKEVWVEANKQINGMFFGGETYGMMLHSCGTPFSFVFKENEKYEVKFNWSPYQCIVVISGIIKNGESWTFNELLKVDNRLNNSNKKCREQFDKTRLY